MARWRGLGLVLAFVASVTACTRSESQPADGAEAGQGTSGGSDGLGGGTAGRGETGGMGGMGAIGGTGGAPSDDAHVIALAAVVLGSCYPDDGVSRNAAELWHFREESGFWRNFRLQAECIAEAGGGCRALDTCLGWTLAASPACIPGRTCDAGVFRNCVERPGYENIEETLRCATLGLECDARAGCAESPPVSCDPETYVGNCVADEPGSCPSSGVLRRGPDCAALGLTCIADASQTPDAIIARCTGTGDACENLSDPLFDGVACAAGTLDTCVNGRKQDFDCASLGEGFTCQSHSGIPFCGLSSECLPAHLQGSGDRDVPQGGIPAPMCEGTSIVFCNAGSLELIDCTTLGFTGCDVEAAFGCVPSPRTELDP